MVETLEPEENNLEQQLVEQFIKLDTEYKRASALTDELKKQRDDKEAELLDLLTAENKKSSARYNGIGHVTCLEPVVANAYILEGQEEVLFSYLRKVDREDLIKTSVHHTSLASFIGQQIKDGKQVPPGVGYGMRQKLRPYPEKK